METKQTKEAKMTKLEKEVIKKASNEYLELKESYDKLKRKYEQAGKDLKRLVDKYGPIETEQFIIDMTIYTKEFFDLKAAKEELDMRILKPYINETEIKRLNVKKAA